MHLVKTEIQVNKVMTDLEVLLALTAIKVLLVQQVLKAHVVELVQLVLPATTDLRVHQAQEAIQVPAILNPVLKETPVLMADQVHKVKLVRTV